MIAKDDKDLEHHSAKVVVLVHPGSFFVSGPAQVNGSKYQDATSALILELEGADEIIVVDGSLSGSLPVWVQSFLAEQDRPEGRVTRIWGCDSGDEPYVGWKDTRGTTVVIEDGQEAAIEALLRERQIVGHFTCVGAWATPDDTSGCVNSVHLRLKELGYESRVDDVACLFEQDMLEEDHEPDCLF